MFNQDLSSKLRAPAGLYRQRGALTLFSAVLLLILMTLALFYASRVSIFETRLSANEVRSKQAFHAAEAAVDCNDSAGDIATIGRVSLLLPEECLLRIEHALIVGKALLIAQQR